MSFRLFGVKVQVQVSFWLTAALLGFASLRALADQPEVSKGAAVAIWIGLVFVSVLVHELGHALVMKRYGLEPEVTLYALGGLTHHRSTVPLRRRDSVLISLAGPFAGFVLGGLGLAAFLLAPRFHVALPTLARFALEQLCWVNFGWGVINLMPVLPLDGGHVLAAALGPKRVQLAAAISTLVGFLVAALFVQRGMVWGALIFGLASLQSYRRFAAAGAQGAEGAEPSAPPEAMTDPRPELTALLRMAQRALGDDALERAALLAQRVLEGDGDLPPGPQQRREALEVIAWTHLLGGHADTAADVLAEVRRGSPPDPALEGAVLLARSDFAGAQRVLEAALAAGDTRKQTVGALVQALIAQDEVGAAAEVALRVVDTLSDDDARRMADLACSHGAFAAGGRLYEAVFDRLRKPEDAYEAARAEARSGQPERALDLLRRAVEAGFSDRARVWSDAALATLWSSPPQDGATWPPALEAVLPRP